MSARWEQELRGIWERVKGRVIEGDLDQNDLTDWVSPLFVLRVLGLGVFRQTSGILGIPIVL